MCCVELALKGLASAVKCLCTRVSPVTDRWPCHAVEPQYGQNYCLWLPRPRDMAVHMLEVMVRPWVGVCVPLGLIYC